MAEESIKVSLKQWLSKFYELTEKIHEITRNLSYAGIALIWIFKNTNDNQILQAKDLIPQELDTALILIVCCLSLDYFTYIWKAVNIYIKFRVTEIKYNKGKFLKKDIEDVKMHPYIEIGSWIFFILKVGFIIAAYIFIYKFLIVRI